MPRNIRPTVYGLNTSNDKRSRFTGPVRRSRVGPLGPVADRSHGGEIEARDQRAAPVRQGLDVAERKIGGVKNARVFSQDHAERSHTAWPHHVRKRTGLGAAFHTSFVDWPQLVHVIGLVGAAAGVVETEQAGNQQRALVVRHRVGTGEHAAGLPVKSLAVGEQQAALGRELPADLRTLSDVPLGQQGTARHASAFGDDETLRLHAGTDQRGSCRAAEYRTVDQRRGSIDDRGRTDVHVDHLRDRADGGSSPDPSLGHMRAPGGTLRELAEPGDQTRAIAVQAQQVGELRRQLVEQNHFATAPFVQHLDFHTVAELGAGPGFQRADVFDRRAVADLVVADVDADVDDADVIAHHAIDEAGVLDHGRFRR